MGAEYAGGDQHNQRTVLDEIEKEVTRDLEQVGPMGSAVTRGLE